MAIDYVKQSEGSEIHYAAVNDQHTTEKQFENDVERIMGSVGWRTTQNGTRTLPAFKGNIEAQTDYDHTLALKTDSLINFVKETQPKEWTKIEGMYGAHTEERFLKRVCDVLEPHDDRDGLVNVLRRGFKMAPAANFKLCYFKPASNKNPDAQARYEANRFELVRQLYYGTLPDDKHNSVDTVLFLNGIPIVTMELKNNLSGQRTDHAVQQYKKDRSPKELLFKPNRRALVHFALDSETVEMTTWLANGATRFLPFNKGNGKNGGGNPLNENGGYRTDYLYREILAPDSLLDIIQRFVRVEYDSSTKAMKAIIFPRYHQLDAVRKLVADAKESGSGKSYLIQHSAGSGKSNSIAWLAHHLQSLHDDNDAPVFDTVVVLTDRRNLDSQLSETIDSVDHKRGVVRRITEKEGSAGLRDALNSGAQIITSTIQKFPYICAETKVSGKKFAVIIDEAHSSQSGKANAKMKMALIDRDIDPDEPWDAQDELDHEMAVQGQIPNLSFFAFTATPKASTLEVFGTRDELCETDKEGMPIPRPFHLYSMKQAIDEGFILDVLENYTCFQTYFKLVKTITDDPRFGETKANRALKGIVSWNPRLIDKKAEIIVEHFMSDVEGLLGHRSKAMVVTSSRPMAYRLYCAINNYIKDNKYACKAMIAFSGKLEVDDKEVTEASLNGIPETQTAEAFDADDKRIIVCANKFQTGFDQPKLCAMYVDKMLTGVAAVQTLVQEHTAKLHASHSIADERVQRGIEGLIITEMLAKYQILGSQHRLAAYVIGIHPFPAARQGTAVEDNHQTVVVGIAQNLLVQTQGLLLVTAEEVYLDTLHTQALQPAHLLLAGNGVIHPVDGTLLYIVPVTTGAIPQEYLHTLAAGILDKLFHAVATDVVVPPVVNQYIFVSHGGRQVNIAHLVVVVDAAVLPENPAPGATARLVIMGGGIAWFHYIPGDGGFHNRLQGFPHRHSTPRRGARQGKGR